MHYCSQEKEVALLHLGEGKRCSTVFRRKDQVLYSSQEKETGVLLFSVEGNMCYIVFRRREHVHCTLLLSEKETGALLFQEKGSGALLFSGEGKWCT